VTTVQDEHTDVAFSEVIKQASWQVHQHAEAQPFMQDLMAGRLELSAFAGLVAQQYFAYQELERLSAAMADDAVAGRFVFPELLRVHALEADLQVLLGDGWRERIEPTEATARYCDRLATTAASWSGHFVAHHYVRYMGDLSGGQVIRRVVERTYGIQGHAGTSFYVFDDVQDLRRFKDDYRARLDATPWTAEERERVIAEVLVAYELNAALIDDLA
jgi:heme oxygenase